MKKNNQSDKNLIDIHAMQGAATAGDERHIPFAQRVALADEKTRSRYNAVRNAFESYRVSSTAERALPHVSEYGEDYYLGGTLLGRVRLVRGYVRLFLALKPSKYPKARYHHKDYTRVARYSDCPLEIDICNSARLQAAYSLIGEVMRRAGATPDSNNIAKDFSSDYDYAAVAAYDAYDYADMAEADRLITDDDIEDDLKSPQSLAAAEAAAAIRGGGQEGHITPGWNGEGQYYHGAYLIGADGEIEPPAPVRMVHRAKVVDGEGKKIGKVRRGMWYDLEGAYVGDFRKGDEGGVHFHDYETIHRGYVDRNDNVVALSGDYMATLRRFPMALLIIILAILIIATTLSGIVGSFFMGSSQNTNYAPVLFISDEHDVDWSDPLTENLPLFYNDTFGTDKIAPGMEGSYSFTLSNRNPHTLIFDLEFECLNEYGIDIAYALYRDNTLVAGSAAHEEKVEAEQLSQYEMTIEPNSDSVFRLEWIWRHNDEVDTVAGENGAAYQISITFTAAVAAAEEE